MSRSVRPSSAWKRVSIVVLATIGLSTSSPILCTAEETDEQIGRTGRFALPGPHTPECDDLLDGIEKYAGLAAAYTVEWVEDTAVSLAETLQGNPGAFIAQVERTWRDLKSGVVYMVEDGFLLPVALFERVFEEVLPGTGIPDFISAGRKFSGDLVASGVTTGLDTFEADVSEIANDLWDVAGNLGDPAAFAEALGSKMQKWNPAASLSYIFTEDDPLAGALKAATALTRQAEILTTYIAPYSSAAAAAKGTTRTAITRDIVFDHVKEGIKEEFRNRSFELIHGGNLSKQHGDALVALTAVVDARVTARRTYGDHPLYRAEVRSVPSVSMKDNHGDDGNVPWSAWHPLVEDGSDCISLGDHVIRDRGAYLLGRSLKALCGPEVARGRNVWWTRPIDYNLVWGDNCSGGTHARSIWAPVCPPGFVGVGFVHAGGSWEKPLPNRCACLQDDIELFDRADGRTAGLQWTADDMGSGAKYSVTMYTRKFAGLELMHAVIGYPGAGYPQSVQVPVSWGTPSPQGIRYTDSAGTPTPERHIEIARRNMAAWKTELQSREGRFGEHRAPASNVYVAQVFPDSEHELGSAYYLNDADEFVHVPASGEPFVLGEKSTSDVPSFYYLLNLEDRDVGVGEHAQFEPRRREAFTLERGGEHVEAGARAATIEQLYFPLNRPPASVAYTTLVQPDWYLVLDGKLYINDENEFVHVPPGAAPKVIGRVISPEQAGVTSGEFAYFIETSDHQLAVDLAGTLWGVLEETFEIGLVQDLTAPKDPPQRPDDPKGTSLDEPDDPTSTAPVTPAYDPTCGYEIGLDAVTDGTTFCVTKDGRLFAFTPDEAISDIGLVVPSDDPQFRTMIRLKIGQKEGTLAIDGESKVWLRESAEYVWEAAGNAYLLPDGATRPTPR